MKKDFYEKRKKALHAMYWEPNNGEDVFLPNGFTHYPEEIYDLFLPLITKDGKALDLGCGNGLLLKHIVLNSPHHIVPFGVDFMDESIKQAQTLILPEYARNFSLCNIRDFTFPHAPYDFTFCDPYDVHPDDMNLILNKVFSAISHEGSLVFYTYTDVLERGNYQSVGDLLPENIGKKLEKRIDNAEVLIGVCYKD